MTAIASAIKRLKQRSKLPQGSRVLTLRCECGHTDWVWSDGITRNVNLSCPYCKKIR